MDLAKPCLSTPSIASTSWVSLPAPPYVHFSARQGTYVPWWKTIEVVIYDWLSDQADAKLSTSATPPKTTYLASAHALHIVIQDVAVEADLSVRGSPTP